MRCESKGNPAPSARIVSSPKRIHVYSFALFLNSKHLHQTQNSDLHLSYICSVKRDTTPSNAPTVRANVFNPVFDRDGRRVRGLWIRNGVYPSQLRLPGQVKQVPLHDATSVPRSVREQQVLKSKVARGEFPAPLETALDPATNPPCGFANTGRGEQR